MTACETVVISGVNSTGGTAFWKDFSANTTENVTFANL